MRECRISATVHQKKTFKCKVHRRPTAGIKPRAIMLWGDRSICPNDIQERSKDIILLFYNNKYLCTDHVCGQSLGLRYSSCLNSSSSNSLVAEADRSDGMPTATPRPLMWRRCFTACYGLLPLPWPPNTSLSLLPLALRADLVLSGPLASPRTVELLP